MTYATTDMYFAAVLRTLRYNIAKMREIDHKKYEFVFVIEEDEIEDIRERYFNRQLAVDAKGLIESIVEMKERIYGR